MKAPFCIRTFHRIGNENKNQPQITNSLSNNNKANVEEEKEVRGQRAICIWNEIVMITTVIEIQVYVHASYTRNAPLIIAASWEFCESIGFP